MNAALPFMRLPARTTGEKIRVLVVDDSLVIRHLVRQALSEEPRIEVVGADADGIAALEHIPQLKPDVVTLDIEMPRMDGLETLRHIRQDHPRLRTIMFSTLTTRGAAVTLEALSLGADDYVPKAANSGSLDKSLGSLRNDLVPKILQFFAQPHQIDVVSKAVASPPPVRLARRPRVVAIGVSTGGPNALAATIPLLPAHLPVPVLVVQHMPAMFTRMLADRLNSSSRLPVSEAEDDVEIKPGRIWIAKGDHHFAVRRVGDTVRSVLHRGPHENSCRPSVDVLFRSLAAVYASDVLAVVLTGMGNDGLRGVRDLKAAGAHAIVQDMATSVVWGMPGSIASAGMADRVLPLDQIAPEIVRLAGN